MEINKKYPMRNGQYYTSAIPKKLIFLHHTAGTTARGAINWWNNTPARVGTAFVIDRDGTVYQTMDAEKWAYHLGVNGDKGDYLDKASIGIELVSCGRVHNEDGKFMFYPLFPKKIKGVEIPESEVVSFKSGRWKGDFQGYTKEQVTSTVLLVKELCSQFGITVQKDFGTKTLHFNQSLIEDDSLSGVFSHSSVRKDKIDIIPQENLIEGLKDLIS